MFADMAEVDRVVGNDDKMRGEAWRAARAAFDSAAVRHRRQRKDRGHRHHGGQGDGAASGGGFQSGLPRVFVQVQNGCDHRCTFCIIPYGRGNSRSVPMGAVVDQVRALVERGHAEIVLTGVDLTSYGADLPGAPKLGQLTKQILRHVPELKRLRISSIDSIEVDRDLLDVIADDERLMPHLHLSLQSGDDLILKRMKRRHSRKRCDRVLRAGAAAAAGHRARRRHHRGLSDRDRGDVRALAGSGRGMRSHLPACVSLFAAPGHAGGADAAGGGRRDQGARQAIARGGEAALQKRLASEIGATRAGADRERHAGPHRAFLPVAIAGETPGAVRALRSPGMMARGWLTYMIRPSSPGLTGRPSTPRPLGQSRPSLEYWIIRFRG